jgi:hypothetical protein
LTSSTGLLQVREGFSAKLKELQTHSNSKLEVVQMEKVKRRMRRTKKRRRKRKRFHRRESEWMILSDHYL